ncbi:MAG: acyl-CoA desaturase [Actinomycetota bacterium]|nr:acyl-CoA desaturase [Actinomycetota bacterium]
MSDSGRVAAGGSVRKDSSAANVGDRSDDSGRSDDSAANVGDRSDDSGRSDRKDSSAASEGRDGAGGSRLRPGVPFVAVHVACLAVFFVGWSPVALAVGVASYAARAFGITGFYHRCFAHRAFQVSRAVQFGGAVLGAAAAQRGPLWWVAHHRAHHRFTDRPGDPHSPRVDGLLRAHLLWLFTPANQHPGLQGVSDLARFREMRLLDRYHHLVPLTVAAGTFGLGALLAGVWPTLHTSAWQVLVWGFVLPTVALYHSTFAVNSIAHRFGRRRFATRDDSRNNWLVALLTLGEGWHNNHHRFPASARQGLSRLEVDPTWLGIRALAALGLARGLRNVPSWALAEARGGRQTDRADGSGSQPGSEPPLHPEQPARVR